MLASALLLALLAPAGQAEITVAATVHADQPLHPVSPLSFGTNVVLSGMSNEKLADLVQPFQQVGLTNLRLHLNTGVDYLWETHAPRPGSKLEEWGIFDPLRDNDPFDRVQALRKVVDPGNSVASDHYRRTDLRCSGVITKTAEARNAYGEVRLTQPTEVAYARCDVWIDAADTVSSPTESPWTLIALRNAEGRTIICAQLERNLGVHGRLLPDLDNPPTSDASVPLTPGAWHSVEIAVKLGAGGWASLSYDRDLVEKHEDIDIPGSPITHARFGCIDSGASGKLWIDGCRVDDQPFRGDLGNGSQHLGRVTFDRAPTNTDDFLAWCEQGGFEPVMQVPVANLADSPWTDDEIIRWFECCNGRPETAGGRLRMERGRNAPYGVTYWELGNEPYYGDEYRDASEGYGARIIRLADRMRAIDPDIRIIANTNYHDDVVFPRIAGAIDLWGLKHFYQPPDRNHSEAEWLPWALGSGVCTNRLAPPGGPDIIGWWYHGDRAKLEQLAPGHGDIPFAQTEYDLWLPRSDEQQSSLLCALYKASVLGQHVHNNVAIVQTFYHPHPDTTVARMYELFTQHCRGDYLACEVDGPTYDFDNSYGGTPQYNTWMVPYVSVFPTREGDTIRLVAINRHQTEDATLQISLEGAAPESVAACTLASDDLYATDLEPQALQARVGDTIEVLLPNQSVSAIEIPTA